MKQTHKTCKTRGAPLNESFSLPGRKIDSYSFGLSHVNRLLLLGSPNLLHHIPAGIKHKSI